MREGDSFLPNAFAEERESILQLYEEKGFANTTVDMVAENVGDSRVKLTYLIEEGKKARIRSVDFVGNDVLSDRELRKLMKTKRGWWFFGGKYEEAKLEYDLREIIEAYGDEGRLEAELSNIDMAYTPNGKGMNLTIHVAEGAEYTVQELNVADNVVFDDDELTEVTEVTAGDVHNKGQVTKDAENLAQGYQDSGYVNAQVTPQVVLDRENKTTQVVHKVSEGELKYVRQIDIAGNEVTKDEVIRRAMVMNPGERFDGSALRASQQRIERTGFFDGARLTLSDVEDHDLFTDVLVDVEEGDIGSFNFGGGFSTDEGLGGFVELNFKNFDITNWGKFTGGGQQLSLRLQVGDQQDSYSLSFTDPEFLGNPFSVGFDIYDTSYRVDGGQSFSQAETGGQLRFGKMLSQYVTLRGSLRYSSIDISDVPLFVNLNPQIPDTREEETTISTRWTLTRDTRDSFIDPTMGARHEFAIQYAGFGGDNDFVKLEHDTTWWKSLGEEKKWVLSLRTREGWVTEVSGSDYVPLQDRFYAGGTSTIRGYDFREVGPQTRDFVFFGERFAIGGDLRWVANVEMKYKLTDMFRFYTFADGGAVWADASDFDLGDMKYSVGLGIGVDVPRMGPMRLDYGFPLNPEDWQGSGRLHLTSGFTF
jgi:outer membrane protein insertion porin family